MYDRYSFMCLFAVFIAVLLDRLEREKKREGRKRMAGLLSGAVFVYCGLWIVWNLICMAAYWYRVLPSDKADWNPIKDIVGMLL